MKTRRACVLLAWLVSGPWLAACGKAVRTAAPVSPTAAVAPAPAPAPAPSAASAASTASSAAAAPAVAPVHTVTLRARLKADTPELSFTLLADAAPAGDDVLRVRAIEVRADATAPPLQRIDGLATQTPRNDGRPPLQFVDLNFDGWADMRLVESRPAGPTVPYLNWLYDPASGRFVASPALDDIPSLRVDPQRRELRSDWRDGATRYGSDVYAYRDGQPVLERRETRVYKSPGRYTLEVARRVGGAWKVVERREGRDP